MRVAEMLPERAEATVSSTLPTQRWDLGIFLEGMGSH